MPALNAAKTLRRAVVSVANQTADDWVLQVLVDPATTDRTLAEAKRLKRAVRGKMHVNVGHHPGLPYQYVELIDRAEPKDGICGFLDADDVLMPQAVERITRVYREDPKVEVVWSQFAFMPNGSRGWSAALPRGRSFMRAFIGSWWGAQHFRTFKKAVYTRSSFQLPLTVPYAVDHSLALVLAAANPKGKFLNEILYGYYIGDGTISRRKTANQRRCYHRGLHLFKAHLRRQRSHARAAQSH